MGKEEGVAMGVAGRRRAGVLGVRAELGSG